MGKCRTSRTKEGHGLFQALHFKVCLGIGMHSIHMLDIQVRENDSCLCRTNKFAKIVLVQCTSAAVHSPGARCGRRLDGVDPEAIGDVPQRLHCLLVRFVVILHEGKMSSSNGRL